MVRSLELRWKPPRNSVVVGYDVTLHSIADSLMRNYSVESVPGQKEVTYLIEHLVGGFAYNVEVRARSDFAIGDAKSAVLRTSEY